MVQKHWKGRKKPKVKPLSDQALQYLEELIEAKDTTFEESEDELQENSTAGEI